MAVDLSIYQNQKTLGDYQQVARDRAMQQAQFQQAQQLGQLDLQSKKNIYATQLISSAVDQPSYDMVRQHLQQAGIDTSGYADDYPTAAAQAQQARMAQSPYGALVNAATKLDADQNAANALNGKPGVTTNLDALRKNIIGVNVAKTSPQIVQSNNPPLPANVDDVQGFKALQDTAQGTPSNTPPPLPYGSQQPAQPPSAATAGLGANSPSASFMPPPQRQDENIGTYQKRVEQAFQSWKEDPTNIAAHAKAEETGKNQAILEKNAIGSSEGFDQISKNLEAIKQLAPTLPQQRYMVPASAQAWYSQNFGDQTAANQETQFNTINEAQTINAIKELAATGQIRMNQRLEGMINKGYLVDPNASPAEKANQADAILAELKNAAINAKNVSAGLNGGVTTPYAEVPTGIKKGATDWKDYFK